MMRLKRSVNLMMLLVDGGVMPQGRGAVPHVVVGGSNTHVMVVMVGYPDRSGRYWRYSCVNWQSMIFRHK